MLSPSSSTINITLLPSLDNPDSSPSKPHHVESSSSPESPPTSFQNPWPSFDTTHTTPIAAFQAKFSRHKPAFVPVPADREGLVKVRHNADFGEAVRQQPGFKAGWIGHASFLLETTASGVPSVTEKRGSASKRGIRILCDPVWSERTSPSQWIGPKRYTPVPCTLESICDAAAGGGVDVVLISHDHYDHLDLATIQKIHALRGSDVIFLAGLGNKRWFQRQGIPANQVMEMDWWDGVEITVKGVGGVKIYCTPTQHFSGRTPFDRGHTLWCSWTVVEVGEGEDNEEGKRCFFAGDTGYRSWPREEMSPSELAELPRCPAFKEIGQRLGPFDLALLPIGLCTPRAFMSNVHCNPWDTVEVHKDLRSRKSVGMHWGTVRGGISQDYEDVRLPPRWWKEASEEAGLKWGEETMLIDIGEIIAV